MQYLFVISGAFSALFSLLLFARKQKQQEHWLLATIFFLITINCIYVFAFSNYSGSAPNFYIPIFSELNFAIPLLYGPLYLFYSKALTTEDYKFKKVNYVHFLPFVLFFIILLVPLVSNLKLPKTSQFGYPLIKLVLTPYYLFSVIILLNNYKKKLLEEYSYEVEVNLIWLNWITIGGIILWLIGSVSYVYNLFVVDNRILLYDYYTLSFLAFFLFALAFIAIRKTDLFSAEIAKRPKLKETVLQPTKVEAEPKSSTEESNKDLEKLQSLMDSESPYLDPLLTLNKLSELAEIPAYRLTKILKTNLESSFYDYINTYRVKTVKEKMQSGEAKRLSILGIAYESGFNSKASFNRVFKKIEGMTPTQYMKGL